MKKRLIKKLFKKWLIKYWDKRLKRIYKYINKSKKYIVKEDYTSLVQIRFWVKVYNNPIIPINAIA